VSDADEALRKLFDEIRGLPGGVRSFPVAPSATPRRVREHLSARYNFDQPQPLANVFDDVRTMLRAWSTPSIHPRHFGLFNPTTDLCSVSADALVALYNPQLSVWGAAPGPVEIEQFTLRALASRLGFSAGEPLATNFTSGGAEANHTAFVAALTRAIPTYPDEGLCGSSARPTVYLSEEAHASFQKSAQTTGVGRGALRFVAVDGAWRMRVRALRERVAQDRASGSTPVMLIATAGTTGAGAIDPLVELAQVARDEGMWFHVDAAWGGVASLSPKTAPLLDGIERADSVTWDAHKGLSVAMGAGMFFCRHPDVLRALFKVEAPYIQRDDDDDRVQPYTSTMQWSRRFIGLKVFLSLATKGWEGMARAVERQCALADRLREGLTRDGWQIVNDTRLPVVCFTHPKVRAGEIPARKLMLAAWRENLGWISELRLGGRVSCLRACVTHTETREEDVDALVEGLRAKLAGS
jgi:glutamate/tyrosine decarboxylase-like PLP-dependent enzyme